MEAGPTVIDSAAYLSLHTSPLLQPGQGNAGGMNVYIDELAATMAARGISVVVYTRRHDPDLPNEFEAPRGYRVVHIEAGPPHEIPVAKLGRYVHKFAMGVIAHITAGAIPPQVVHSHYWLSGWAGLAVKRQLGIPLANSFHTLGRVKNLAKRTGEPPESLLRIAAEHEVIHLGAHETPVGIFRRARDGLTLQVQRRVDQDRDAGPTLEGPEKAVVDRVGLAGHGLHSRRAIDVSDRGNPRALFWPHRHDLEHVGALACDLEEARRVFDRH